MIVIAHNTIPDFYSFYLTTFLQEYIYDLKC